MLLCGHCWDADVLVRPSCGVGTSARRLGRSRRATGPWARSAFPLVRSMWQSRDTKWLYKSGYILLKAFGEPFLWKGAFNPEHKVMSWFAGYCSTALGIAPCPAAQTNPQKTKQCSFPSCSSDPGTFLQSAEGEGHTTWARSCIPIVGFAHRNSSPLEYAPALLLCPWQSCKQSRKTALQDQLLISACG